SDVALSGKQYVELRFVRATANEAVVGLYADPTLTFTTGDSVVIQRWNTASGGVGAGGPWSLYLRANYGGTGELYDSGFADLPGTNPVDRVIGFAVDTTTRQVWLRLGTGAWYGGGDPAAGTSPSFVLQGTDAIYVAVSSNHQNNYTHLQTVAQHVNATPAGFTNFMTAPGAISGAASFALTATATIDQPPAGPIAGTASVAFAATGTLTPPPASHPVFDPTTLTANGTLSN